MIQKIGNRHILWEYFFRTALNVLWSSDDYSGIHLLKFHRAMYKCG